MCVGTFSGVTSPGMVISSALAGTTRGNSSPTRARIIEVFPHCAEGSKTDSISMGCVVRADRQHINGVVRADRQHINVGCG